MHTRQNTMMECGPHPPGADVGAASIARGELGKRGAACKDARVSRADWCERYFCKGSAFGLVIDGSPDRSRDAAATGAIGESIRRAWLADLAGQVHGASCGTYGHPQARADMRTHGLVAGRNTVTFSAGWPLLAGQHSSVEARCAGAGTTQ